MHTQAGPGSAPQLASAAGGWRVAPEQVRAFAAAVAEVRAGLEHLRLAAREVAADPPLLGTSPVGDGLSAKFADRAGNDGLVGELNRVIGQLETFVGTAERTVAEYRDGDGSAASSLSGQ